MELLSGVLDPELLKSLLGEAAGSEFFRMCALFSLAALVHSRQVRKEIRIQLGALTAVIGKDLSAQQEVLGKLADRVTKIEVKLKL